jgi:hypothetical protein
MLEGNRVRPEPEPISPENLEVFVRWFADPEVTRYVSRRHPPS